MKIFIDQPHGIGDYLFIQKIAKHYAGKGLDVVVPILDRIKWVADYLEPHPKISCPVLGTDYEFSNDFTNLHNQTSKNPFKSPVKFADKFVFLPVGSSYQAVKGSMMTSKYSFLGLDWSDWADYVKIIRNQRRESELEAQLGIHGSYSLVNGRCSTGEMEINTELKAVYLREIEGFTLFDWIGIIEKAERVITIDTSLVLLCEVLKLQKPLYVISRYKPVSFEPIEKILKLPWKFITDPENMKIGE